MPFHLSLLTGGNQIVADGWDHENFNALSKGKPRGQHQGKAGLPSRSGKELQDLQV